jgi:aspartyl-tRNA(Asn)/glutamyl-tRNA(Gln) amidotransferase subunit C
MDSSLIAGIARLARLRLEPGEAERYAGQMGRILEWAGAIESVGTEGVEPFRHAMEMDGPLREDRKAGPQPRENLMANTKHSLDGFFRVPRVIE